MKELDSGGRRGRGAGVHSLRCTLAYGLIWTDFKGNNLPELVGLILLRSVRGFGESGGRMCGGRHLV